MQGFHGRISKEFATNFTGTSSKLGMLKFFVSLGTIAQATEVSRRGEEWFNSTKFKLQNCDEYMKDEYVGTDIPTGILRTYLKEDYSKLLMTIHKYFSY